MLSKKTLDQTSQDYLLEILSKDKESLSADERAFLRARADYLSETEKQNFGLVKPPKKQVYLK